MIYNEPDEAFHLELTHTRSRKYVLLYGRSEVTKYLLCLPVHAPEGEKVL
jgi:protease II